MIFGVAHIVSYLSRFMSLQAGDVISTGTPPGVGMGVKPEAVFLRAGQDHASGHRRPGRATAEDHRRLIAASSLHHRGLSAASVLRRHPVAQPNPIQ